MYEIFLIKIKININTPIYVPPFIRSDIYEQYVM